MRMIFSANFEADIETNEQADAIESGITALLEAMGYENVQVTCDGEPA